MQWLQGSIDDCCIFVSNRLIYELLSNNSLDVTGMNLLVAVFVSGIEQISGVRASCQTGSKPNSQQNGDQAPATSAKLCYEC